MALEVVGVAGTFGLAAVLFAWFARQSMPLWQVALVASIVAGIISVVCICVTVVFAFRGAWWRGLYGLGLVSLALGVLIAIFSLAALSLAADNLNPGDLAFLSTVSQVATTFVIALAAALAFLARTGPPDRES